MEPVPTRKKKNRRMPRVFSELITDGEAFNFDVDDIQRIRSEFQTLIKNLHPLYQGVKDNKIKAEKEEKKARRVLRRKEKAAAAATATIQNTTPQSTESADTALHETGSTALTSNTNESPGQIIDAATPPKSPCGSANDSSDSSKENRVGADQGEEKPATKMQASNDEKSEVIQHPLTWEATQRLATAGTLQTDDPSGQMSGEDMILSDDEGSAMSTTGIEKKETIPSTPLKRNTKEYAEDDILTSEDEKNGDLIII